MKVTPHIWIVFVDAHEPKHLPTWSLEIKVRIGHVELFHAEGENVPFHSSVLSALSSR